MGYDMQMAFPPDDVVAGYVPPLPGYEDRFLCSNHAMDDMVAVMVAAAVMDTTAVPEDFPAWPPKGISQKRVDTLGAVFCVEGAEGLIGHDCTDQMTSREERLFDAWALATNAILTRRSDQPGKVLSCKFSSQRSWYVWPEECQWIASGLLAGLARQESALHAPYVRSGMAPEAAAAWIRKWALFNQMAAENGGYRVS
ncbi:MAG: hypothetical protein K0Q68_315 [Moraxellaceae bacterium]|jgi:hypothetical protein|nr:hypothetical protein [Moraxellaceae bacterium]